MATQYVTGASPVSFISEDTTSGKAGKQYQIPLAQLTVTNGQPDATNWLTAVGFISSTGPDTTDVTLIKNLLNSLTAQGFLRIVTTT